MKKIKNNRAFGLIEILIATVVLAIGLLGVAIIQQKAMLLSQDNDNSAIAAMLIADIANRINANKAGADKTTQNFYLSPNPVLACDPYQAACTPQQIANADVFEWNALVAQSLPSGVATICLDSVPENNANSLNCNGIRTTTGDGVYPSIVYTIKIRWTDTKNNNLYRMNQTFIPCSSTGCT